MQLLAAKLASLGLAKRQRDAGGGSPNLSQMAGQDFLHVTNRQYPGTLGGRSQMRGTARHVGSVQSAARIDRASPQLGREGVDLECGDVAVFLCSALSSYVTRVLLPVDGGTWAAGGWVHGKNGKWTLDEGLSFGR